MVSLAGSGKTTLLSVLTGRIQAKSGQVTLGGRPLTKNLRRMLCYVMQQDIFFPNLTVKDTLMVSLNLNFSAFFSEVKQLNSENYFHKMRLCICRIWKSAICLGIFSLDLNECTIFILNECKIDSFESMQDRLTCFLFLF